MPIPRPPAIRQPVLAPNLPPPNAKITNLPPTLPPTRKDPLVLRGGAEYALADPRNPYQPPQPPVPRPIDKSNIPPGSPRFWHGGTVGILDRLPANTKRFLGITGSNKLT